ncbi:MAG TPA: flagellin [bacterium]|jgi:flagellar hook-associated protein 3 FlgL
MRISEVQRHRSFTQNVDQRLVNMNRIQEEIGTGRSLFTPSEGVSRANQALTARDALATDGQFLRNIDDGRTWVDAADSKLQAVVDLLNEIDALAVSADNSSQTPEDRQATALQLDQKLETLMGLANAKNGDRYLFGGYGTTTSPFSAARDANGKIQGAVANPDTIAGKIYRRIGDGDDIQINVSGAQLFQPVGAEGTDGDVFYVISALRDTIGNNNTPPAGYEDTRSNEHLRDQLATIRERITQQQTYLGSIGQRLDQTKSRLKERELNLTNSLEDAQGVDMPSLVARMATESGAYNALAAMGQKLLGQSLVDYLG